MDEQGNNEFETEAPTVTRASVPMRAIMADLATAVQTALANGLPVRDAYAALLAGER